MFNTKLEVDRHVENCLKQINSETERNLRCLPFARLYFKVGDYEQARRYVSCYLSAKPLSSEGQLLLGKILEKQGKREAALTAYRTSLDLDPKQNNLVIKVCELLASDDVNLDLPAAKYFCEKAQSFDPHHPAVFTLKERLVASESNDPSEVSRFLLKELETRPMDVKLRVRLLRHLLQNNQVKDAYKHASDIEEKHLSLFLNNLSWYETVTEVLVRYRRDSGSNRSIPSDFWILYVSVLDRLISLTLDERSDHVKNSSECVSLVFNFDQVLKTAAESLSGVSERQLTQEFLNHYRGQLCFHLYTLLFKQAKKDLIKFKEATNVGLPLLFGAYHAQPPELNALWLTHASEARRERVKRWHKEAAFRCSQAGHIILALVKDRKSSVTEKAILHSSGTWREQLFKKLFITREQQTKLKTSYFATCAQLADIVVRLPEPLDVSGYDSEALLVHPDSLHHHIWLCLNQPFPRFDCGGTFEGLQYSVKNLNNCAAETLNVLDVQAFVYCATLCARAELERARKFSYGGKDRPPVLPAAITEQLGSANQAKWFVAAYRMYRNEYGADLGDVRLTLIRGIEVVRCVGNHGLDAKLLVTLANTFAERSKNLTKQSEIEFSDSRAELYWRTALQLLEKMKKNQSCASSAQKMFDHKPKEMSQSEIHRHIEHGKLFLARQLMKQKDYEKALTTFEALKDPYASFYQGQIYKAMAEEQSNDADENVTSQMRNQQLILLTKARDAFYLTLDRLREPAVDANHPLNAELALEIERTERALLRFGPDYGSANRNECDGMSDENESSASSTDRYTSHMPSFANSSYLNGSVATPKRDTPRVASFRREARPSPERLDAQLRQLTASKDAAIGHVLEQNRLMVEAHRGLVDELRSFRDAVSSLTSAVGELQSLKHTVEDLRGVKDSVDQLKHSVDELQDFRNVSDVVYEMKKELAELKKSGGSKGKSGAAQLSEEDLYNLDEEFGADYSLGSGLAGFNPSLFPSYQGRVPAAGSFAYPQAPMYPGMYPMAYYAGLGIPQAGALPFSPEQQLAAELRAMNTLSQNLNQSNLSQPNYPPQGLIPPPALGQVPFAQTPLQPPLNLTQPQPPQLFKETAASTSSANVFASIQPPGATFTTTSSASGNGKAAPVNVVITASDPLPTGKPTTAQPILSVTIPPQHLKGAKSQPHNYQIPLPAAGLAAVSSAPSVLNQSPLPVATQSILTNVAPPVYSAIGEKSPGRSAGLGLQIEKSLSQSFNSELNQSNKSNASISSVEEHDPCPDFKPVVPLPDEVPVNTGEESETVLFCERAKLFRYTDKEWKERGVGNIKILHNPETGKVRIIMRRDQVHKICANHFLTKETALTPMPNNDRAYIWAANDFADQEVVLEKLCVKFKTAEEALKFSKAFENAKTYIKDGSNAKKEVQQTPKTTPKSAEPQTSLGGFVFTSTPTFKPKDPAVVVEEIKPVEVQKSSPFAGFSFTSKLPATTTTAAASPSLFGSSDFKPVEPAVTPAKVTPASPQSEESAIEFVPTAEFKPLIPLPEIVEVKTGEENAEVLFEMRGKLLRYESSTKEWKERGLGTMKILKENNTIRLLMRREQVHKVCCNHQLLKNTSFTKMSTCPKAISWCAQDFSEEVLKTELFAMRFKTEEQSDAFLKAVTSAQKSLNENNVIGDKKKEKSPKKAASGERNQHAKLKTEPEKPPEVKSSGWGDKFKPKSGSWNCKNCYITNESKDNHCIACETPKNSSVPAKKDSEQTFSFGGVSPSNQPGFVFGQAKPTAAPVSGFGDAFKPKSGSWQCDTCYVSNDASKTHCVSCESPKDATVAKKEPSKGVNLDTPGLKFSFGIPSAASATGTATKPTSTFSFTPQPATGFSFGANQSETAREPFVFKPADSTPAKKSPGGDESKQNEFVFGSPQQHGFEFTPRSPRRQSGGQGDEESDGSCVEEEDNIYFKPVIPLPDKVDVKTGEEQEEVLYCHRAKLFRFVQGEWKERGIGDVKILFRAETKKLRVVMRREQVLKICLNHVLTSDIEYMPKDDKTWLFSAPDFSEGEINHQQFCLRFKTSEIADEFKKAIDSALAKAASGDAGAKTEPKPDDSDLEIVFETKVTPEEEQEAKKLGLPPKFFSYRQLPDCNCDQCKKDDVYLKDLFKDSESSTNVTIFGTPASIFTTSYASSPFSTPNSMFNTPPSTVSPFNTSTTSVFGAGDQKTAELNKSPSLKELLIKPSIFDSAAKQKGEGEPTTANANKGIFGGGTANKKEESVFKNFSFASESTAPKFSEDKPSGFGSFSFTPASTTVFGTTTSTTVFGTPTSTTVFGTPTSTTVFGTPTPTTVFGTPTSTTVFGTPTPTTVFGTPTSTAVFGTPTSFGGSIFAPTTTASTGGLFGSTAPVFGGSLFGGGATSVTPTSGAKPAEENKFGSAPLFGKPQALSQAAPVFGAAVKDNVPTFGSIIRDEKKSADGKDIEAVLPCDSSLSFANLAASSTDKPAFGSAAAADEKNAFNFLGAGAPVFGGGRRSAKKDDADKDKTNSGDEGEGAEEEYDPHYEPIVPLPAAVVVSTGEEEERQLFNQRAKLFRFDADNKEWKERGVGEMKLLHHPVNNTYRLLLRREQVHKVVLNQLITPDLDLQPMNTSDKAWLWGGYNYTDDEVALEKLAARFKNTEIANQFYEAVYKAIQAVKENQANKSVVVPSTVQNYGLEDISGDDEPVLGEHEDDDEDEDDDDDDENEDDRSVMFVKRCTLSEQLPSGEWKDVAVGDLEVYYDPELYGVRIYICDENSPTASNTIIGVNTVMQHEGNWCSWRAVERASDEPQWKNLKATFSDEAAADEFYMNYEEGLNYAQQIDFVDEIVDEAHGETD